MSQSVKHVPKHRAAPTRSPLVDPRRAVRGTVVLSSVAVAATGLSVAGGVLASPGSGPVEAATAASTSLVTAGAEAVDTDTETGQSEDVAATDETSPAELGSRSAVVSRSDRRDATDPAKAQALAATDAPAVSGSLDIADADPRDIALTLLPEYGFSSDQFSCLDYLWTKESGWDVYADNPTSSAYGIPQSLPGEKMASAGADWVDNPETQIRWGLGYIRDRYGSPCSAWSHSQAVNWY